MIIADLHVHSNYSDGQLSISELTDFYGSRGFGAIAITDHLCERQSFLGRAAQYLKYTLTEENFDQYMHEIEVEGRRAWNQYRMKVIPGYEITKNSISNSRSAHIVALNARKFVSADRDVVDICRQIRAQDALAIAAHPVSTRKFEKQTYFLWDRRRELRHELDAWEVASGPVLFEEVLASGLPLVASSDFHRPGQIRAWKTVFNCRPETGAILQSILSQDLSFQFYAGDCSSDVPDLRPYQIHPYGGAPGFVAKGQYQLA
ncbi:MAG: hypothetical protein C5B47_03175 [Verrucomicrobia bacterium]|nr:MAG: hypothetical protein C5B47_03175 [Verrucomicrobiota bacterium]